MRSGLSPLLAIFLALVALSGVAYWTYPAPPANGRLRLVWASDDNPARAEQIKEFNRECPNLFLALDAGNAGIEKLLLQCSSGVGPDVFDLEDDELETYVSAGLLMDVTDEAARQGFSASESWPGGAMLMTLNGRQYGYPCNIGTDVLIYNKVIFDRAGIPYPRGDMTWDELADLGERFTQAKNGPPGVFGISGLSWRDFFGSQRGEFFDAEGLPAIRDSEALRRAFECYRDLIFQRHAMLSGIESMAMAAQGGWRMGDFAQFITGRFAMIATGDWSLIAFRQALDDFKRTHKSDPKAEPPFRLGCTRLPHFKGMPPCYRLSSRLAGINAASLRRKESVAFLAYLAGSPYATLVNRGMDWLPGNPHKADLGVEPGPPELARVEMHRATESAMSFGYVPRQSPFLSISDIGRVLDAQTSRLESDPGISIDELLGSAQRELDVLVHRNVIRDPRLVEKFAAAHASAAP